MIVGFIVMLPLVASIWLTVLISRSAARRRPHQDSMRVPLAAADGGRASARPDDVGPVDLPSWTPLDDIQLDRLLKDASAG